MYYFDFLNTYLISSTICFFMDYFVPKSRVKEYSKKDTIKEYKNMLPNISFNLCLAYPFFNYFEKIIENQEENNLNGSLNFLLWLVTTDFIFYTIHYSLHSKYLYFIHKKHHEYDYTFGAGAIYAHPIEFIGCNIFPAVAPFILYKTPVRYISGIIYFSTSYTVIISHGCYKFFRKAHLEHHIKRRVNYGLFISDRFFLYFSKDKKN